MFSQLSLQEVGLWEVWIEYDQFHPTQFGTLYVLGEMITGAPGSATISRCDGGMEGELMLKLSSSTGHRNRMKEVLYSEPVKNLDQYHRVSIYANDELIAFFDDIEVLI